MQSITPEPLSVLLNTNLHARPEVTPEDGIGEILKFSLPSNGLRTSAKEEEDLDRNECDDRVRLEDRTSIREVLASRADVPEGHRAGHLWASVWT